MRSLSIKNLTKEFGKMKAINDVNLEVEEGKILAIIGPNGSGKTTLFNLITGYFPASFGRIIFKGEDITNLPPYTITKKGISRSFQICNIFPNMTVFENIRIGVISNSRQSLRLFTPIKTLDELKEKTMSILQAIGLEDGKDIAAGTLSHGDQKSLEIGIALTNEPSLMLLDEPTAGMSPEETTNTINLIRSIASDRKITIIFTEHDLNVVFSISERVVVLQQGAIIADGSGEQIRRNERVKEAYLGG